MATRKLTNSESSSVNSRFHKFSKLGIFTAYAISLLFILLPLMSFAKPDYFQGLEKKDYDFIVSALSVTASCSFIATLVVVLFGIPAGYFMARYHFKGKRFVDMLLQVPMVLPPAVMGLILLMTFGTRGFIGKFLAHIGIQVTFSKTAVILTLIFVSLPVFVSGVCDGFRSVDRDLETTALLLGDSPSQVFRRVTFPLARPSVLTALILSWARGIAEFGATMMFAGNVTGITQTVPLAIYTSMESNMNLSMLLSFMMLLLSLVILLTVRLIGGWDYPHKGRCINC